MNHILRKIEKCLALSKSSNVHEAAAALRQANALMRKHHLTMSDVEANKLEVVEIGSKHERPPKWKDMLCQIIAVAFGCSNFQYGGRPVFVGKAPSPQVCKYAYDVLLRQLERNKREFLEEVPPKLRRAAGKAYAEGWAMGCYRQVKQFAGEIPEEEAALHKKKVTDHYKQPEVIQKRPKKSALDSDLGQLAGRAGYIDGQKAKIHQGMGTDAPVTKIGRVG